MSRRVLPLILLCMVGVLMAALLFAWGGWAQPARGAATFVVTKTTDTNDGVCDADCSLREAIGAANSLAGADTIVLPAGAYTLSIAGADEDANATGDLDITGSLTINGAGAATTIINGGGIDRVLDIPFFTVTVTVIVSDVTITGGSVVYPGGIAVQGIYTMMTLNRSTVRGNTAGGIWSISPGG